MIKNNELGFENTEFESSVGPLSKCSQSNVGDIWVNGMAELKDIHLDVICI